MDRTDFYRLTAVPTRYALIFAAWYLWFSISVLVSPSAAALAAPRTIHVAPTGSDNADSSAEKPLKSLKRALALAETGDTIQLAPGAYAGKVKTRVPAVTMTGPASAIISSPGERGLEILHDKTILRGVTIEKCDIGIWLYGANDCLLEGLTIRDIGGEGVRIKNQACRNVVRQCRFERMGREGFDAAAGRKNGEGIYIGTAPEQRSKNQPPNVPDRCLANIIEECTFKTEAAEAVDMKEDSEENIARRCTAEDSRDPDGPIFGSRGDRNRFEGCIAKGGLGHGFRFGGDTVPQGKYGQPANRTYGMENILRQCRAEGNALYGAALMVLPQDLDDSNTFVGNGRGPIKK